MNESVRVKGPQTKLRKYEGKSQVEEKQKLRSKRSIPDK